MDNDKVNNLEPFKVYCNGIEIGTSPFDFSFILRRVSALGNEILGEITMSPEHAKAFSNILVENINNYENIFGTIPTQPKEEILEKLQAEGKIFVKDVKNE